ncbi:MAG: N-acetyltransferase [Thermomicrobium sp.]|nr:GNAT family N-acetyltransferase [Thermomicrobium sp.]MDW8059497.1 N-acetyltransferase [Thermomicrobium sp.]
MAGQTIRLISVQRVAGQDLWILPATFRDLTALARLQRCCFDPRQAYSLFTFLVLWFWPGVRLLVARVGDELVGSIVGDRRGRHARILNLCVRPAWRRRGIATVLLAALEQELDADLYTLMVEDKNAPAFALYRRFGYVPVAEVRHYYGRNRHGVLMQKRRGERASWRE